MRELLKTCGYVVIAWILLAGVFVAIGSLTYRIYNPTLVANVAEAEREIAHEGLYPRPWVNLPPLQYDYFTDALIIAQCGARTDAGALSDALTTPFYRVDELGSGASAILAYEAGANISTAYYGRYWHGMTALLIPLLSVMDIHAVRIIQQIIMYLLAALLLVLTYRKLGRAPTFALLTALLVTAFPIVANCFQYSACYFVLMVASIIILSISKDRLSLTNMSLLLFATGAVTCYLDIMTTPILTAGIPIAMLLLRRDRFPDWRMMIQTLCFWGVGFFGMFITRWVLTAVLTDVDMTSNTEGAAMHLLDFVWNSGPEHWATHIGFFCAVICLLIVSVSAYVVLKRRAEYKEAVSRYTPLFVLGILPCIWVLVIQLHSVLHYWFVWRIFALYIFCMLIFFWQKPMVIKNSLRSRAISRDAAYSSDSLTRAELRCAPRKDATDFVGPRIFRKFALRFSESVILCSRLN